MPEAARLTLAPEGPWLVVGLGNPGPAYAGHRHNVGRMVLDVLAERLGARFSSSRRGADLIEGRWDGDRVVLAKPRAYMNESGGPVSALSRYLKVPVARLVVVHDELDLPYGVLRVKAGGGDNGHNGLKALRRALGSGDFVRVRFGIGRPPGRQDPAEFVLRDFSPAERRDLPLHLERTADAVECVVSDGVPAAQNAYNG